MSTQATTSGPANSNAQRAEVDDRPGHRISRVLVRLANRGCWPNWLDDYRPSRRRR